MTERVLIDTALRYFLAVVRYGSINKASVQLHVAPSAVSRQISHLEAELGTQLFERQNSGMRLSPSGELLADHARKARLEALRVVNEITGLEGIQKGKVRIASIEGPATYYLPYLISRFRERYSGIHFELIACSNSNVTRRVQEGVSDIGLTLSPPPARGIRVEKRISSPVNAIMSRDHPLATRKQVTLAQLSGYPLALPLESTSIRNLFDISCSRQGLLLEPVMVSNYVNALINFALSGGGVTLFGELSVRHHSDRASLAVLPIKDREMSSRTIEIQTLAGRTLPKGVAAFLEMLCQELA
ncbi:LysR family transcriptional regulator [Pseudomonas daroniae]|uniref:LysR family transcriptional regulator n=1 Tax=Phytopseudomonas daroniae TaxID=2487519 RepID=A0A4Q9QRI8_9GAMM|nr:MULTISPECIES: LysR family transcriptional regulator [Pseudomonas]TBU83459.1 LysR family transcriptional regulator [Pseudomonas daroniae]TBU85098.1 LysR family transcriptional regulator [Pseudomonas sp. FRB 228]TBU93609.1 LysR family transcriptional regulator [Pseudomonas daroniae]